MFSGLEQPVFCTSDMTLPTPLRARGALRQNYGMKRTLLFVLAFIAVGPVALEAQEPMELNELVQRDDIYLTPETFQPYTGPVFLMRNPSMVGLWAGLRNGKWHGLYELYHDETGQLISKGEFRDGEQCGEWLEEGRAVTYPPCPPGPEVGN